MKQAYAEVQILDRIMYLLEESSVTHLMKSDEDFAAYVDELYSTLEAKSQHLQQKAVSQI